MSQPVAVRLTWMRVRVTHFMRVTSSLFAVSLGCDLRQSGLDALGDLLGRVDSPEVHEEEARALAEHVGVERRDADAVRLELPDDRVDLVGYEHEVARRRDAAPDGLEVDRVRHPHARGDLPLPLADRFGARHAELQDRAG